MIILSEPWPIEAEASPSMRLIQSATAFPLCDGTTPNPILCHNKPSSICNVALRSGIPGFFWKFKTVSQELMRSLKIQCGVRTPSRRPAVIWGGFQGEKGVSAPLTLQSRCEEGKMRVLIGFLVHGILQTQQKSQVSLLVPSLRITRLKPMQASCKDALYSTCYNVELAGNGVIQTSHIHNWGLSKIPFTFW